jgi:hypothetical protein
MPRISYFLGITIRMYWDEAHHQRPHFHAEYGADMASIAFDGTVLGGNLPPRALRFVREWTALHQDELMSNWERARAEEPLEQIAPLS